MDHDDEKHKLRCLNKWWCYARTIAHHYGKVHQAHKMVEECCELAEAIMHNLDNGKKTKEQVADELADVAVLIPQMAYLLGVEQNVVKRIEYKYRRQINRIANENKTE